MWRGGGGPLRFHIPLIKPDVRISRIRLSDKVITLSPTGSCVFALGASPAPAFDPGTCPGSVKFPDLEPYVSHTTTDGADAGRGRPRPGRLSVSSPNHRATP